MYPKTANDSAEVTRSGPRIGRDHAGGVLIDLRDDPRPPAPDPIRDTVGVPSHLELVRAAPFPLQPLRHRLALRLFDLMAVLAIAIAAIPMIVLVTGILSLTSGRPVFYSQERTGRGGMTFRCLKFRTMRPDAEDRLHAVLQDPNLAAEWARSRKLTADPRVTPIGRLLRLLDIDELPQLWNVMRGEMSLVGPRPIPMNEVELFGPDLRAVLSVKPGMTGLWQVSGRNRLTHAQRVALDVQYAREQSLTTNVKLLAKTLKMLTDKSQYIE